MKKTKRPGRIGRLARQVAMALIILQFTSCTLTPEATQAFFQRFVNGFAYGFLLSRLNNLEF
jgi:hypothetical protein